jgi:hypothetical protein
MPNMASHAHNVVRRLVANPLRLRRVCTVTAITLSAFVWLGPYGPAHQSDQRTVSCKLAVAERFSVGAGKESRFSNLTRTPDDEPLLFFADLKTGRSLQVCLFKQRSPAMALESKDHQLALSTPFSGPPAIQLSNSLRRSGIEMQVDSGKAPNFNLTDRTRRKISFSPAGSNDEPAIISLFDKTETSRIRVVDSPEATLFSLYDSLRHPSVDVTADADNVPLLRLRDPHLRISNTFK